MNEVSVNFNKPPAITHKNPQEKPPGKNYLGIDYGAKRIGLATSTGIISTPLATIPNSSQSIKQIQDIIKTYNIDTIIIGLPLYKDGNESPMSLAVRDFGKNFENVEYHNEIFTSREAEEHIRQNLGISNPKKIREIVDRVAASMILSSWLYGKKGNNK